MRSKVIYRSQTVRQTPRIHLHGYRVDIFRYHDLAPGFRYILQLYLAMPFSLCNNLSSTATFMMGDYASSGDGLNPPPPGFFMGGRREDENAASVN